LSFSCSTHHALATRSACAPRTEDTAATHTHECLFCLCVMTNIDLCILRGGGGRMADRTRIVFFACAHAHKQLLEGCAYSTSVLYRAPALYCMSNTLPMPAHLHPPAYRSSANACASKPACI
jgi:hypothetical protein